MTAVYTVDIRGLAEKKEKLLEMLLPERREKALCYRFPEDQLRCIAGGLLMQEILGVRDGGDLAFNRYGKPYLKSGGIHFNLSHAGDYAAMAVDGQPVGVDIEKIGRADAEVAQRCFQEIEMEYVFGETGDPDERFYSVWTLKESLMKASGLGLNLAPETFCVLPLGTAEQGGRIWRFRQYKPDKDHILSVCAARDDFAPGLIKIEF
jgi:4'-phosphopantetheinyl transferase